MLKKVANNQHLILVKNRITNQKGICIPDPNVTIQGNDNWDNPDLFGEDPIIEHVAADGDQVLELSEHPDGQTVDLSTSSVIQTLENVYIPVLELQPKLDGNISVKPRN